MQLCCSYIMYNVPIIISPDVCNPFQNSLILLHIYYWRWSAYSSTFYKLKKLKWHTDIFISICLILFSIEHISRSDRIVCFISSKRDDNPCLWTTWFFLALCQNGRLFYNLISFYYRTALTKMANTTQKAKKLSNVHLGNMALYSF